MMLQGLIAQAVAATPPPTREEAELARIQAETAKLNAEADKTKAEIQAQAEAKAKAAQAESEAKAKAAEAARPLQCNIREGKWCHVIRVGANWRMVHPNAGNGVFSTEDDPYGRPEPQYTYDPAADGLFGALGVYAEYHNRWIRIGGENGPFILGGVAFGWGKTKHTLDSSDRPTGLQDSTIRQTEWSVGLPLGVEFPIKNDALTGLSLLLIPSYVRNNYNADAKGVGQSEGVYITGTERNEGEGGEQLAPTVHRLPGRTASGFGFDVELRTHLSEWLDLTVGYGIRKTGNFEDRVGDSQRLRDRGLTDEEIEASGRGDIPIDVTPPNDQYFMLGFGGRFEFLGGK